jgi:hypothetical protein
MILNMSDIDKWKSNHFLKHVYTYESEIIRPLDFWKIAIQTLARKYSLFKLLRRVYSLKLILT